MEIMNTIFLNNSLRSWLIAAGVAVITYIGLLILRRFILRYLRTLALRTVNTLDDLIADLIEDIRKFLLLILALYAGSVVLAIPANIVRFIDIALIGSILLQTGFWGNRIISFLIVNFVQKRGGNADDKKSIPTILQFVSRMFLWSVIFLLTLDNLGIDITTLLAGLGIGGIAVALALQNVLGDLFASLSILLDKPFEVGDSILVDDYQGTVEQIGIKTTRLRSISGEQSIFSNTDLLQSRIRNYKRMSERRIVFHIGVVYQTPLEKLKNIPALIREIITSQDKTRFDRVHFKEYGDSSLMFEIVYYILSPDYNLYMDIQERINLKIYERFEQERVDFAYPTRTIIIQGKQNE